MRSRPPARTARRTPTTTGGTQLSSPSSGRKATRMSVVASRARLPVLPPSARLPRKGSAPADRGREDPIGAGRRSHPAGALAESRGQSSGVAVTGAPPGRGSSPWRLGHPPATKRMPVLVSFLMQAGMMNNARRATLIWSLGAVIFSLVGVSTAVGSNGVWYLIVSAGANFLAGAAFAARAVNTLPSAQASEPSGR